MSHDQLLEYEFESTICSELSERGWLYQDEGDTRAAAWPSSPATSSTGCPPSTRTNTTRRSPRTSRTGNETKPSATSSPT